jgi:hypothetical protein
MEARILKDILKKLDIQEKDIFSLAETHPEEHVKLMGIDEKVKGKFQYYEVCLHSGTEFYLKRNHITGELHSIEDIGFQFMR